MGRKIIVGIATLQDKGVEGLVAHMNKYSLTCTMVSLCLKEEDDRDYECVRSGVAQADK